MPIDSANNDFGFSSRKKSNFSSFQLMNLTILTWFQFSLTPKKPTYLCSIPHYTIRIPSFFMGIHMKFFELSVSPHFIFCLADISQSQLLCDQNSAQIVTRIIVSRILIKINVHKQNSNQIQCGLNSLKIRWLSVFKFLWQMTLSYVFCSALLVIPCLEVYKTKVLCTHISSMTWKMCDIAFRVSN